MRARFLLFAFSVFVVACQPAPSDLIAPPDREEPRVSTSVNCYLSVEICGNVSNGISHLETHPSDEYKSAGNMLRLLFTEDVHGFQPADPPVATAGMYVVMTEDSSAPSGFRRSNENIFVASASSNRASVGGLLAHEYEHFIGNDGPGHNTNTCNVRRGVCEI